MEKMKSNVNVFDQDAKIYGGYQYTTSTRLSSKLVLQRSLDLILQIDQFKGRSILDIGCGDGFSTILFWDHSQCSSLIGVDAAPHAIEVANANKKDRPIQFIVGDAQNLPFPDNNFDLVLIQSMLHHVDDPLGTIREAFRLAPEVLIHESNGNSLALKLRARTGHYHREHNEKVFSTYKINNWIKKSGGKVVYKKFANFVPTFCPNWLAKAMKRMEPLVEPLPLLNSQLCSMFVFLATRQK